MVPLRPSTSWIFWKTASWAGVGLGGAFPAGGASGVFVFCSADFRVFASAVASPFP